MIDEFLSPNPKLSLIDRVSELEHEILRLTDIVHTLAKSQEVVVDKLLFIHAMISDSNELTIQ